MSTSGVSVPASPAVDVTTLSVHPVRDVQQVTSTWVPTNVAPIAGVVSHEITNVITNNGFLTEMWRAEWRLDGGGIEQVFQRTLAPGSISAWHVHLETTDRLFCALGEVLVALYDARSTSPTHGVLAEYRFGEHRPLVVSVPPGVVHGVRALGNAPAVLVNAVDRAYGYEEPDHLRLPHDSPEIPYRF